MILKEDILNFYKVLRRYEHHDRVVVLTIKHFYPKVASRLTMKEFAVKVETLINMALKAKKGE